MKLDSNRIKGTVRDRWLPGVPWADQHRAI